MFDSVGSTSERMYADVATYITSLQRISSADLMQQQITIQIIWGCIKTVLPWNKEEQEKNRSLSVVNTNCASDNNLISCRVPLPHAFQRHQVHSQMFTTHKFVFECAREACATMRTGSWCVLVPSTKFKRRPPTAPAADDYTAAGLSRERIQEVWSRGAFMNK
jgi:hypothetical protein